MIGGANISLYDVFIFSEQLNLNFIIIKLDLLSENLKKFKQALSNGV